MKLLDKKNISRDEYAHEIIKRCEQFVAENNMMELQCGKHEIAGEEFYVNIIEYETKNEKECMWEAHRQYLDVHYLISGEEIIKISSVDHMLIDKYFEENDYVKLEGEAQHSVTLKENEFLVLFLEDAHKTGCCSEIPMKVKKAIFKIKK